MSKYFDDSKAFLDSWRKYLLKNVNVSDLLFFVMEGNNNFDFPGKKGK
jgi:hypothetical protein